MIKHACLTELGFCFRKDSRQRDLHLPGCQTPAEAGMRVTTGGADLDDANSKTSIIRLSM